MISLCFHFIVIHRLTADFTRHSWPFTWYNWRKQLTLWTLAPCTVPTMTLASFRIFALLWMCQLLIKLHVKHQNSASFYVEIHKLYYWLLTCRQISLNSTAQLCAIWCLPPVLLVRMVCYKTVISFHTSTQKSFTCTALIDSFWSFWQVCFSGLGILTFCQIVPFWADSTSVVCRCICCTFDQMLRSWSTVDKPVINECSTVPSHNTCSCQSGHGIVYQQRRENDIRTFSFIHKR